MAWQGAWIDGSTFPGFGSLYLQLDVVGCTFVVFVGMGELRGGWSAWWMALRGLSVVALRLRGGCWFLLLGDLLVLWCDGSSVTVLWS